MPKPLPGPLPIPEGVEILEAQLPPPEAPSRGGGPAASGRGCSSVPPSLEPDAAAGTGREPEPSALTRARAAPLPPEQQGWGDGWGGGRGAGGGGGSWGSRGGDECLRLRHVLVDKLLEDHTLGLLLQGTCIVGFCSPQAEGCGWLVGDQIVEINGQRVTVFEEFIDRFREAQEQGFPIDFSVLRCEFVDAARAEAEEALDSFFNDTKLTDIAGLMQRKFGATPVPRESLAETSAEPLVHHWEEEDSEAITENPYIQALRKRREDLSKAADGWQMDDGNEPLAVQLATQQSGGLATLTITSEARRRQAAGLGEPLAWAGCAAGSSRQCGSREAVCMATYDIQPTPRPDIDTEVDTWAGLDVVKQADGSMKAADGALL